MVKASISRALTHPCDREIVKADHCATPPTHRKRLVWNGVCGCREIVSELPPGSRQEDDTHGVELILGEVSEPLS